MQALINAAISFSGRIDRRRFVGGMLLTMAACTAVAVAIFTPAYTALVLLENRLHVSARRRESVEAWTTVLTVVIVGLPYLWISMALMAKRFRDLGVRAWLGLGTLCTISALDSGVLAHFTEARFPQPFASYTPVGGVILVAAYLVLVFAPGRAPKLDAVFA